MNQKVKRYNKGQGLYITIAIFVVLLLFGCWKSIVGSITDEANYNKSFRIIASTANASFDDEIIAYGDKNNMNITIDHYGDLEIVDIMMQ